MVTGQSINGGVGAVIQNRDRGGWEWAGRVGVGGFTGRRGIRKRKDASAWVWLAEVCVGSANRDGMGDEEANGSAGRVGDGDGDEVGESKGL